MKTLVLIKSKILRFYKLVHIMKSKENYTNRQCTEDVAKIPSKLWVSTEPKKCSLLERVVIFKISKITKILVLYLISPIIYLIRTFKNKGTSYRARKINHSNPQPLWRMKITRSTDLSIVNFPLCLKL